MKRGTKIKNNNALKLLTNGMAWEKPLTIHEYRFLKSYLCAVSSKRFTDAQLTITRCMGMNFFSHRPVFPSTIDSGSEIFPQINDDILSVSVQWENAEYEICVFIEEADNSRSHAAYCIGLSYNAVFPHELLEYCVLHAIRNSYYKNKILRISPTENFNDGIVISAVVISGRNLSEIFLAKESAESLRMFVDAVKQYDTIKQPLRYLLSGKPGTGKTESVRAIMNECRNAATFLFVEGNCNMQQVFEVASYFSPAILCMDDIDLICGTREQHHNKGLGVFLSMMDGFRSSDLFVLATTNDKQWVDVAASRPGRFDVVLDMEVIESTLHCDLIHQRCRNEKLLELFTDDVLEMMRQKKVSGAFVVNLIKQLEIKYQLTPEVVDNEYLLTNFDRLHKGFYKRPSPVLESAFGFETN